MLTSTIWYGSPIGKRKSSSPCAVGLLILLAILLSGCSHLNLHGGGIPLPAIDPNGSCLFLPPPNKTQLTIPPVHSKGDQTGFLPAPAYQAPEPPAACVDASCEPAGVCNLFQRKDHCVHKIHEHFRPPGKAGEIQLTPLRVVAPVGGEVVFLAGICGDDGFLVKREPIEWMLSPESVGQIIEVNDDAPGKLSGLLHPSRPKVEKLGVDFARGRTSGKNQVIDRGTPSCQDDIHVREGETWVSISSPTAGVSRLTVLAPESNLWDRRRQTAVVYWLDAQWQFPQAQIAPSGSTVQLATRVTKSEGLVPATDWMVQYTVLDPSVASLANVQTGTTGQQVRVRVDENGQAIATVAAVPNARGTTGILIEVISPAMPADHLPEIIVGRGETFVTFSSPGLELQAFGPESANVGELLTYGASLGNPGDLNAENARLSLNVPPGMRLQSATPQPTSQTDSGAVWDQGVLGAGRQLDVSATLQAAQSGVYEVLFQAEAAGLSSNSSVRTEVADATVDVRFAPADGVSQAEIGSVVQYEIDIRNTGRQALANLRLLIEADPGIVEASQGVSRVEQDISLLQPGELRSLGVPFQIRQEGQQTVLLRIVTAGQQVLAERRATILGLPARPRRPEVGVNIQFPWTESGAVPVVRAGQTFLALVTIRNSGETRLTGLSVQISTDPSLMEFTGVDINNQSSVRADSNGRITWTPADMLSGQGGDIIRRLWINVRARAPTTSAAISARAIAAEGVESEDSRQTAIQTAESTAPPVLPQEPAGPGTAGSDALTGQLTISLNDFNDPTLVGRQIRYGLRVANGSNRPNRRVHIEVIQPEGTRLVGISRDGEPITPTFGQQRRFLLPIIEFMRPGEELFYIMVLVPEVPQQMVVRARTYSDIFPTPVETEESTTVVTQ
jgi:uncharacterized repeat protein (TIGR01451 family)